jgi:hypothetical protein
MAAKDLAGWPAHPKTWRLPSPERNLCNNGINPANNLAAVLRGFSKKCRPQNETVIFV